MPQVKFVTAFLHSLRSLSRLSQSKFSCGAVQPRGLKHFAACSRDPPECRQGAGPIAWNFSWLMNGVSLTLLSQNVRLSRDGRLTQFLQLSMISLWAPSRSSWLCHGRCTGLARSELPSSSVGASLAGFGPGPHVLFLLAPGFQGSTRCWHSAPVEFISTLGLLTGKSLFK